MVEKPLEKVLEVLGAKGGAPRGQDRTRVCNMTAKKLKDAAEEKKLIQRAIAAANEFANNNYDDTV